MTRLLAVSAALTLAGAAVVAAAIIVLHVAQAADGRLV